MDLKDLLLSAFMNHYSQSKNTLLFHSFLHVTTPLKALVFLLNTGLEIVKLNKDFLKNTIKMIYENEFFKHFNCL